MPLESVFVTTTVSVSVFLNISTGNDADEYAASPEPPTDIVISLSVRENETSYEYITHPVPLLLFEDVYWNVLLVVKFITGIIAIVYCDAPLLHFTVNVVPFVHDVVTVIVSVPFGAKHKTNKPFVPLTGKLYVVSGLIEDIEEVMDVELVSILIIVLVHSSNTVIK